MAQPAGPSLCDRIRDSNDSAATSTQRAFTYPACLSKGNDDGFSFSRSNGAAHRLRSPPLLVRWSNGDENNVSGSSEERMRGSVGKRTTYGAQVRMNGLAGRRCLVRCYAAEARRNRHDSATGPGSRRRRECIEMAWARRLRIWDPYPQPDSVLVLPFPWHGTPPSMPPHVAPMLPSLRQVVYILAFSVKPGIFSWPKADLSSLTHTSMHTRGQPHSLSPFPVRNRQLAS